MDCRIYLQLLATGRYAKKGLYRHNSSRVLRFDVKLYDGEGVDYESLKTKSFSFFSLCASPTMKHSGDQRFDDIVERYRDRVPSERINDFDKLYEIWKTYHLNGMKAGTKKQESFVAKLRDNKPNITYSEICDELKNANLYNDNGYVYGSSWLTRGIPKKDVAFIKRICEEWKEKPDVH